MNHIHSEKQFKKAAPWMLPALLGYNNGQWYMIAMLAFIFIICDAPFLNRQQQFVLQRVGKRQWISGQLLYLVVLSFLFAVVTWLCTWVFLLPELRLNKAENTYQFFTNLDRAYPMPQILLCSSDLIAVGLMAALKERGYHIPRDVGVVGFDDISIAAFSEPPLTTVAQDMRQLGRSCFQVLLNRMENRNQTPQETIVRAKIVIRDSVRL